MHSIRNISKKFILTVLSIIPLTFACNDGSSSPTPTPENPNYTFFYSDDYSGGSAIYSLNLTTLEASIALAGTTAMDFKLFFDPSKTEYFVAKRFFSKPSTLLKFGTDGRLAGEIGSLGTNIYNLLKTNQGNSLLTVAWDKGELSETTSDLVSASKATFTPTGLDIANKIEDARLIGAAMVNNSYFIISGGMDRSYLPTQAKVHKLTADLAKIDLTYPIPDCKNISSIGTDGIVKLTDSSFLLTCNPQYTAQINEQISIIKIDLSTATPTFTTLKTAKSAVNLSAYFIRGVSKDGGFAFVENKVFNSMGVEDSSTNYWMNLATKEEIPVTKYNGPMFYSAITNKYIFACNFNEQGKCKDKTLAVVEPDITSLTNYVAEKAVKYEYTLRAFPNIF